MFCVCRKPTQSNRCLNTEPLHLHHHPNLTQIQRGCKFVHSNKITTSSPAARRICVGWSLLRDRVGGGQRCSRRVGYGAIIDEEFRTCCCYIRDFGLTHFMFLVSGLFMEDNNKVDNSQKFVISMYFGFAWKLREYPNFLVNQSLKMQKNAAIFKYFFISYRRNIFITPERWDDEANFLLCTLFRLEDRSKLESKVRKMGLSRHSHKFKRKSNF